MKLFNWIPAAILFPFACIGVIALIAWAAVSVSGDIATYGDQGDFGNHFGHVPPDQKLLDKMHKWGGEQ